MTVKTFVQPMLLQVVEISTNVESIESLQRYAGRAITGQLRTTPVEAILTEAKRQSIKTQAI